MRISVLLSILFYFSCIISGFLGFYSLYIDPKAKLNRNFFALCISLSIWAIGFSVAITASDMETCLLWRRISALGWGSMYSILLHFFLILTQKDSLLKKWWVYLLLYLPATIIIYIFAISNNMALQQYNLVETSFGWTNISVNNGWDWLFNIYYAGFMLSGLGMVWQWGRISYSEKVKKQVILILSSFFIAFLLGTATDIICNSFLSMSIPQMAPIIISMPIIVIYYSIKRYGLMRPKHVNEDVEILNESTRTKVYSYLSISFVVGSILSFVVQYLYYDNVYLPLFSSTFILLLGLIIHIIKRLKVGEYSKDIFLIVTISLAIPSITLVFIQFGSITVWAFSFIFIVISLVFNKRIVLVSIAISILSTQVLVWILMPEVIVKVDEVDFTARIGIFCIAIWLAFYVNKVYIMKLKENADQLSIQKVIAEISTDFVTVNQVNIDEKINQTLERVGKLFLVDRAYVFLFDSEKDTMTYTHEWCSEGIEPEIGTIQDIPIDVFPWWMEKIRSDGVVHIPDVEKLPEEASVEKQQLARQHVQSLISMPITSKGRVLGFLGFDSVQSIKEWRDEHINLLKIIANILADALAKVDAENEINYMAYYDQLTKLPNRLLFKDRVDQAIHLASRMERMVGVIFLDLDSFKTVNDTMGHEGGDELLNKVAQGLSQSVRKTDTVSRFGGDEFLVMINNISEGKDLIKIIDIIMNLFNKPFVLKGQEFFITASTGIAVYPTDGEDTETLIKNADIAMYNAKDKGKNQYVLCSSDMKDEVQKKMKLTNSLYRAQERNELVLYYQPQISLLSKKIIGLEALIRWDHPELGRVTPGIFIPIAEQTGLINPIGEWGLRTACLQNKAWQDLGLPHVRMAVNLSVNQFRNSKLVDQVNNILKETGLKPEYLELEITEGIAIKESDYIIGVLNDLKKLGVSISIDDFGTEYSSLSRLKMLPIDRIKMDMQFVRGIEGNEKDRAITKVIINLAKSLGLKVIAEGVETEQQLEFLSQRMCDEVQGFYYFKPMTSEEIERVLREY